MLSARFSLEAISLRSACRNKRLALDESGPFRHIVASIEMVETVYGGIEACRDALVQNIFLNWIGRSQITSPFGKGGLWGICFLCMCEIYPSVGTEKFAE